MAPNAPSLLEDLEKAKKFSSPAEVTWQLRGVRRMKTKFTSTVRARETFAKKTSHVLGCKPRCSGGEHLKYNKRFSLNGPTHGP